MRNTISEPVVRPIGWSSQRARSVLAAEVRSEPQTTTPSRLRLAAHKHRAMRFVLLRTQARVAAMSAPISALMREVLAAPDATYTPEYFLPRLNAGAEPRVVACYEGERLVGVVYTYERAVCSVRTGFAFGGDQMGRGLVLAAPEREQEILEASCNFLLGQGIHAMLFDWTPQNSHTHDPVKLKKTGIRVKTIADPRTEGDWLPLQLDYESFLATLGPHTRRNLRYYRRRVEAAGYSYTGVLPAGDFDAALGQLNTLADYPMDPERLARDKRYFDSFGSPVIAGLRASSGEFVSLIAGFTSGNHLHILTQLNGENEETRKLSLSLVLRGYLIEDFIARGCTAVHFFQGSSPMLGRFCPPVDLQHLAIDDQSVLMTPFKRACSSLAGALQRRGKRVPYRLQYAAGSYWA
jgi:hypothetical protein